MKFKGKEEPAEVVSLRQSLEKVLKGLKFSLIELIVSRHRGSVQVRAVIYNGASIGTDDCAKVHRAIMPRLELAFAGQESLPGMTNHERSNPPDIYLEVSSPGIEKLIKDGNEFRHYTGKMVRCYRTDITEWTAGLLESAGEEGIILRTKDGAEKLSFDIIAKAKLDSVNNPVSGLKEEV